MAASIENTGRPLYLINWFKITSLVYDRNTNSIIVSGYNSNMLVNIDYASLNVFCMSYHLDIKNNLDEVIERTKMYGIKVGLVLNPDDDVEKIYPYLDKIDLVLIMTVIPGLPGQELIKDVLPKISTLKEKIKKEKRNILISVDGGINLDNKKLLHDVDILVSGSCITKSDDYQKTINELRKG